MRVAVYSDLHNEFSRFEVPSVHADVIVLAGDIDVLGRGVTWANEVFTKTVIYCCGNHEFFRGHIDRTLEKMRAVAAPHVHVLENQILHIDGVRFIVATAWTDYTSTGNEVMAALVCSQNMNDFKKIRADTNYRRLRPADLITRNHATYRFLKGALETPFGGKTVVVTHHCPIRESAGDEFDEHYSAAYYNEWHDLVVLADVWFFGHTHACVDMFYEGCRLVSNPRGYPNEDTGGGREN
ncbi:metallophosphoesterase [Pseudomonas syringae]|uniref:metallophosphoesterase n=1 Tax=Pseudomonas syringae TaxID=317 RepID=UPI0009EA89F9|nr:metallophosphoesterase family protein [Pseudomonas syringae]